jgi:hypothetical protein
MDHSLLQKKRDIPGKTFTRHFLSLTQIKNTHLVAFLTPALIDNKCVANPWICY